MINSLRKKDARINFFYAKVSKSLNFRQKKLHRKIADFLRIYCVYHKLNNQKILNLYFKFLKAYSRDCKKFSKTKKYPFVLNNRINKTNRISYELALIISCLLTDHRFKIMDQITKLKTLKKSLFIGVGTGLEIYILKNKLHNFIAYDPKSSNFIFKIIKKKYFKKRKYNFSINNLDTIFAIEFLEHLSNPYEFLENIFLSMKKGSRLICTTAKNIPQFDHLFNFKSQKSFESKVKKIGFRINFKKILLHTEEFQKINSDNVFYILKK